MAHGIAGPLAALSLAARHGVQVPGQSEAIALFARWLDWYGGSYWTPRAHLDTKRPSGPEPARQSWCYGRPGIARAQQLAALALRDANRRQAAEDTLIHTLTDPFTLARITDATLCHGWAGLIALTRAVAADSPTPERFTPVVDNLHQRLTADLDRLPKPGFMEGRSGAHLALNASNATDWTSVLLIT
ncbi:lanthionine synthetase LanC family protein [Streptomyces rectiviolaceus]